MPASRPRRGGKIAALSHCLVMTYASCSAMRRTDHRGEVSHD
jgi:hypothetical protein